MSKLLFKDKSYATIGACMEVHKELGKGFSEIIYKGTLLPHYYIADFVINNEIILEIKAISELTSSHIKQN